MKLYILFVVAFMMTGCSQSQKTTGQNIIKTTNIVKNVKNLTWQGVHEELIVKTKNTIDPARGGGFMKY